MQTCPKCHSGTPEGMRFCLQCGSSLLVPPASTATPVVGTHAAMPEAPVARPAPRDAGNPPSAPPRAPVMATHTIPLKIAPTPVMFPRSPSASGILRPSLGDAADEIDDELLKKAFERPLTHPGAVVCRFCKGPLDLLGDFCEQCGAPVEEAAPPGALQPKPQPVGPPDPVPVASYPSMAGQAAPPAPSLALNATGGHSSATPPASGNPAAYTEPTLSSPPPIQPAEEHSSGLMGRLKGLFKKG